MPEAVQIFIEPPDDDALKDRLVGRGTDDPDAIARRLAVAESELAAADEFQYRVVNDRLDEAVARLQEIVSGALESSL
jgi:guanylate kinase